MPADIRILEFKSISLMVDEAPLTGESVSVQKTTKPMDHDVKIL